LSAVPAGDRGRAATYAYTYLHLLLVGGVVLAALGLEVAMAHIESADSFGLFGAAALGGGVACYLAGTAAFARRLLGTWNFARLVFATVFVALSPLLGLLTPAVALASVAGLLFVLLLVERRLERTVKALAS